MKFQLAATAVAAALFAPGARAWGREGHFAVGYIAQNFLQPDVADQVAQILDPEYEGQLAPASVWADEIKRDPKYRGWSNVLHYMDTADNPGKECFVDEETDCPDGKCIVGAIANYTTQLDCENGFDEAARTDALKFLTHFIGDITQPLHVCGREKGGNGHDVTFRGRSSNLHSLWDTGMVRARLEQYDGDIKAYADALTEEITNGTFAADADSWIACTTPTRRRRGLLNAMIKRAEATTRCPLQWATDSNSLNCPTVWEFIDENEGVDLEGEYYETAAPFIDEQIAKGGYRLGVYLNEVLGRCVNTQ